MYLAIDIGGTKTLVAELTNSGVVKQRIQFPTHKTYAFFRGELADTVAKMSTSDITAIGVAAPGKIDRERGVGLVMGNLPWKNVPLRKDIAAMLDCDNIIIENDSKAAGLAEALALKKQFNRVLYVTIGTGIGVALIVDQKIDPALADAEGGHIILQYGDKLLTWEEIASGRAIVERFGKRADTITKEKAWKEIAHRLGLGLFDMIATLQPEVVVLGGGVGRHFTHFKAYLEQELQQYEMPLVPIPPVRPATYAEDSVLYGCYSLAKDKYGNTGLQA